MNGTNTKKGYLEPQSGAPDDAELALINKFSRRKLSAGEVFVFSVVLCDNEIDRDFERFTIDALRALAKLYVGKTGIFDHSMKGRDQLARIFRCEVEQVPERTTAAGEAYHRLKARAYIPRLPKNEEIILEIDAGIKKEVSVGCAVSASRCSVCGAARKSGGCAHVPGRAYQTDKGTALCHTLLESPSDAFEWSFVAVPAQRGAGVVKAFSPDGAPKPEEATKSAHKPESPESAGLPALKKALAAGAALTAGQVKALLCHIERCERAAKAGESYLSSLRADVLRLSALCHPELSFDAAESIAARLSVSELEALKDAYRASADKILPAAAQLLAREGPGEASANRKFMI